MRTLKLMCNLKNEQRIRSDLIKTVQWASDWVQECEVKHFLSQDLDPAGLLALIGVFVERGVSEEHLVVFTDRASWYTVLGGGTVCSMWLILHTCIFSALPRLQHCPFPRQMFVQVFAWDTGAWARSIHKHTYTKRSLRRGNLWKIGFIDLLLWELDYTHIIAERNTHDKRHCGCHNLESVQWIAA